MKFDESYRIIFERDREVDSLDDFPEVGSTIKPPFEDMYGTMCDIEGVSFEVKVVSHFEGKYTVGYVGEVQVDQLTDECKTKMWHRGLLQQPQRAFSSHGQLLLPWGSYRQMQTVAIPTSRNVDMTRLKKWWEDEENQYGEPVEMELLFCVPWRDEMESWQPIDYAYEWSDYVYQLDPPPFDSDLNLFNFVMVEETGNTSETVEDQVLKVVVLWRVEEDAVISDPIRTFRARLPTAHLVIQGMGGHQNPREWQCEADDQLYHDPASIVTE